LQKKGLYFFLARLNFEDEEFCIFSVEEKKRRLFFNDETTKEIED